MRRIAAAALFAACGCALAPKPSAEDALVRAVREEAHAQGRAERLFAWLAGTTGEQAPANFWPAHDGLLGRTTREALARAEAREPDAAERLALRLLRRSLALRAVQRATAPFDAQLSQAELLLSQPVAYRNLSMALAGEADPARRAMLAAAEAGFLDAQLNPILEKREAAAQAATREAGYADPAALAEDMREVSLAGLLQDGAVYLRTTDASYLRELDRAARAELGVSRAELRLADLPRLWKAPGLAAHFPVSGALPALRAYLAGLGLDLGSVQIDDAPRDGKRARAFVAPIDAPADVRLSVKPAGGLDDYWTLFHEAGHALHFSSAGRGPRELSEEGFAAPSEAYGELFASAFADAGWLSRHRALFGNFDNRDLAKVLRRTALVEVLYLRRYAVAKVAYELALHGRPLAELAPALELLAPDARARAGTSLRALWRELNGLAYGVALTDQDASRYRSDVDDAFASADYARCFALAAQLDEGLRARFGAAWTERPEAGAFLRRELFAQGGALTAEQVAARLGFPPHVDFALAARRSLRLFAEADALEAAQP